MFEVKLRAPLNVEWEITKSCNLRCRHCYLDAGRELPHELTTKEALTLIAELDELGVSDVTISGGEPLLRKDLWEILSEMERRDIPFTVYTNGTILNSARIQRLKEVGVKMLSVSLNGAKPRTHNLIQNANTFQKILNSIKLLKNEGLQVQILYTLMKTNMHETEDMVALAENIGAAYLCIYPFYSIGRGDENRETLSLDGTAVKTFLTMILKRTKKHSVGVYVGGCLSRSYSPRKEKKDSLIKGAPCAKLMAVITADGHLRPCNFLPFQTRKSVREKRLTELWKDPLFERIRDWDKSVQLDCSNCQRFPICFGSCLSMHLDKLDPTFKSELEKWGGAPSKTPSVL